MKTKEKLLVTLCTLVILFSATLRVKADWYDYDYAYAYAEEPTCTREVLYEAIDDGITSIKIEKEYNDLGLVISEAYYSLNDSNELMQEDFTSYEYDDKGRIIKWDYFSYEDGKGALRQTKTYEYIGNKGKNTLVLHEEDRDLVVEEEEVEYDNKAREVSVVTKELNDKEEMVLSSECFYTYEDNSTIAKRYYYEDDKVVDGYYQITKYDDQGREIAYIQKDYNPKTKEFDLSEEVIEYVYDALGNCIVSKYEIDGEPSSYFTSSYELNENGYLKTDTSIFEGEESPMGIKNEYEYDENGNEIKIVYYDYTEDRQWEYEGTTTKEYDDRGLLSSEHSNDIYDGEESETLYKYTYELVHLDLRRIKEEGYQAYYHCDECGKDYSDANGQTIIYDLDAWKENNKEEETNVPVEENKSNNTIVYVLLGAAVLVVVGIVVFRKKDNKQ